LSTDEHLREAVSRSLDIFVERIEAGMDLCTIGKIGTKDPEAIPPN